MSEDVRERIAIVIDEAIEGFPMGPGEGPSEHSWLAADRVLAVLGERGEPSGDVVYESDERHGARCPCPRCRLPEDEPVAWGLRTADGTTIMATASPQSAREWEAIQDECAVIPLYAHPPTASAPEEPARAEETPR